MSQIADQSSRSYNYGGSKLHDRSTPGSIVFLFNAVMVLAFICLAQFASPVRAQQPNLQQTEQTLRKLVRSSKSSIVTIARCFSKNPASIALPDTPNFNPSEFTTGVVVSDDGFLLAPYHTLGQPDSNKYFIYGQSKNDSTPKWLGQASVHAADPWMDLAILKLETDGLVKTQLAGVDDSMLPTPAYMIQAAASYPNTNVLIANSITLNQSSSLRAEETSKGTSKVLNRYQHGGLLLATPSARPASGNVVLNANGELLGVCTLRVPIDAFVPGAANIMPVDDTFTKAVTSLLAGIPTNAPLLGISFSDGESTDSPATEAGVVVSRVGTATPALSAGLRTNDRVIAINSTNVESKHHAQQLIETFFAGQTISITVVRQGESTVSLLDVTLAKRFVAGPQPPVATTKPFDFAGLSIDYVTASAPSEFRQYAADIPALGAVLVKAVEVDSAAWKTGVRAGMLVSKVNGTPCTSPVEFQQLTESIDLPNTTLTVIQAGKTSQIKLGE